MTPFRLAKYKTLRHLLGQFYFLFFSAGYVPARITAKVADRFEAGTDSEIYLKLKNRDTGEECETGMLYRSHGNEWARGTTESIGLEYKRASCWFFSPSQNGELVFNIKNAGSDDLLLESVMLHFAVHGSMFDSYMHRSGYPTLVFTWNGTHWFHSENQGSWHDVGLDYRTTGYRLGLGNDWYMDTRMSQFFFF